MVVMEWKKIREAQERIKGLRTIPVEITAFRIRAGENKPKVKRDIKLIWRGKIERNYSSSLLNKIDFEEPITVIRDKFKRSNEAIFCAADHNSEIPCQSLL